MCVICLFLIPKRQEGLFAHVAARNRLFLLSPSIEDRKNQNACESLPLNMEPVSGMYTNGLAVLDFKSLYPSVMIARDQRIASVLTFRWPWLG